MVALKDSVFNGFREEWPSCAKYATPSRAFLVLRTQRVQFDRCQSSDGQPTAVTVRIGGAVGGEKGAALSALRDRDPVFGQNARHFEGPKGGAPRGVEARKGRVLSGTALSGGPGGDPWRLDSYEARALCNEGF